MFVWARALCGLRICCSASVDSSAVIRKIHMGKIRRHQGVSRACYHDGFHDLGTFDEDPGTVQSPGVRADAQCFPHGSKNLLQRVILYRHEKILLRQGRLQAQTQENYVGGSGGYSLISLDQCVRLGSCLLWT